MSLPTNDTIRVRPRAPIASRIAYAAAHVIPLADSDTAPGGDVALDWDHTLAFRRHLWSWGLGVAEAMDTAQRGAGLPWPAARELIQRSVAEAAACGGLIVAGAGTDQLDTAHTLADVRAAYEQQIGFVEGTGAGVVIMASRQLAAVADGADAYRRVYSGLLDQVSRPVILHWLGEMFDPALAGYWGSTDRADATDVFVSIVREHREVVDGVKVSLLDADHERQLRSLLPPGVRIYTGDDFNYAELIRGDGHRHSDALLGAFAAIAPAASCALQALDRDDLATYDAILEPTLALSRHVFAAPTRFYKTGIAFLAWLNGLQPGFTMIGGQQSARSAAHLLRTYRLALTAGVLSDPDGAERRMAHFRGVTGLGR